MRNENDNSNKGSVSIIVSVYNKRIYLADCLNSLVHQTWPNLEIIVIDDGSTDGSWEELNTMLREETFSRVILLQIPHAGPSVARNIGTDRAAGDFITFVDADDFVETDYIEHMVQGIGDADFCLAGHKRWDQRENQWEERRACTGVFNIDEFYERLDSLHSVVGGIGWKLYRKSFLIENRIRFPESFDRGEDNLFIEHVLLCAKRVACIDYMEYIARRHDLFSLTHQTITAEVLENRIEACQRLVELNGHPVMISRLKNGQIECLGELGKIYCYQHISMRERKKSFFSKAKEYELEKVSVKPRGKTGAITRFSLKTRTFLPFYCFTKLWYRGKENRKMYLGG